MINESSYWKDDLTKIAARMTKRSKQHKWTERSFFNFEKDVFFAFYAIRKLIEADKLSQEIVDSQVKAVYYPTTGKGVRKINSLSLDKHFDLEKAQNTLLDLRFVCNQIIHSYIFLPLLSGEGDGLAGMCFCSDRERNQQLYYMDLTELISCLNKVANDNPNAMTGIWDDKIRDYKVTAYTRS